MLARTSCIAALAIALVVINARALAVEQRCGWLSNPTPANWWLKDSDAEWTLSEQGGYQAAGIDSLPDMTRRGWVSTNVGSYGYGCACLKVIVDPVRKRVTRLLAAEPLPLARCRGDRRLSGREPAG
jgi:hypothetical protein